MTRRSAAEKWERQASRHIVSFTFRQLERLFARDNVTLAEIGRMSDPPISREGVRQIYKRYFASWLKVTGSSRAAKWREKRRANLALQQAASELRPPKSPKLRKLWNELKGRGFEVRIKQQRLWVVNGFTCAIALPRHKLFDALLVLRVPKKNCDFAIYWYENLAIVIPHDKLDRVRKYQSGSLNPGLYFRVAPKRSNAEGKISGHGVKARDYVNRYVLLNR